ncbi:MAG: carcinine hydrolase/isopenicillin-N N-acyltransferase family protein [Dermatophilaceae bacterium]
MGTSDCLWAYLMGINEDGLAVSLTFGGRPGSPASASPWSCALARGRGDVAEAVARVRTLPVAQAYNLTFVDAAGTVATVFVAPGDEEVITSPGSVSQRITDSTSWNIPQMRPSVALPRASRPADPTCQRRRDAAEVVGAFLREPVRSSLFSAGFGSLFMADLYRWKVASRTAGPANVDAPVRRS